MKVAVFLPTRHYGGMDVFEASIARQTYKPTLIMVADELQDLRRDLWMAMKDRLGIPIFVFKVPKRPEAYRTLATSYNFALDSVRRWDDFDLFISLQDYFWVPSTGIQRFIDVHMANPEGLISGAASLYDDPHPDSIDDERGLYSLWKLPYTGMPEECGWRDCRIRTGPIVEERSPVEFETNWACVPRSVFMDRETRFDEDYDLGAAYENQDYAIQALHNHNARTLVDQGNEVRGLPHKKYFDFEAGDLPFCEANLERHRAKWEEA